MIVSQEIVEELFLGLLGRLPEPSAVETFLQMDSTVEVLEAIMGSVEFRAKHRGSPLFHYKSCFDAEGLIYKYAVNQPQSRPGLYVNFLGVAISPRFLPEVLCDTEGRVEGMPIPANWHSDIAEWGAVLRAIDLATDTFTMAELGCGWGCWINNSCVTAKRAGLTVHGIGVEGDRGHIEFAREACELNGLSADEVTLHHAIASGIDGVALFPVQECAGHDWGMAAVFDATREQRDRAKIEGTHVELPTMSMTKVAGGRKLDLLHIDIQGAETDVVRNSLEFLNESVAYLVIGTHSRQIEGELLDILVEQGWMLEIERPAIADVIGGKPVLVVDGVQGWRNPSLDTNAVNDAIPAETYKVKLNFVGQPTLSEDKKVLTFQVRVKNEGTMPIYGFGKKPVNLGVQILGTGRSGLDNGGFRDFVRVPLPLIVPGDSAIISVSVPPDVRASGRQLRFATVQEFVRWYDDPESILEAGPFQIVDGRFVDDPNNRKAK